MATIAEQRAKLNEKINRLKEREKLLANKEKTQERKARTKRLIELGAFIESFMSEESIAVLKKFDAADKKTLDSYIKDFEQNKLEKQRKEYGL